MFDRRGSKMMDINGEANVLTSLEMMAQLKLIQICILKEFVITFKTELDTR